MVGLSAGCLAMVILQISGSRLSVLFTLALPLVAAYSLLVRPEKRAYISNAMVTGAIDIVVWAVSLPLVAGRNRALDAGFMRDNFGSLIGWVLFGLLFGFSLQVFHRIVFSIWGGEMAPETASKTPITFKESSMLV
jgi:hypothetical protein